MAEEIIINCGWYRNGSCGCATEDKKCEQIKLCKFKDDKLKQQLQRLEQENKQMKSVLEEIENILEIHKDELEECLHNDIDGMIQNKINEVLNDSRERT
jgi:hypothetical protein